jgi:hypothetical protein
MYFLNLLKRKRTFREKIIGKLSSPVKNLLDYIEEYAGFEIEFTENTFPINQTDPNPNAPVGEFSSTYGKIYVKDSANTDEEGILHMLLFMKRYWIDKVPQIVPAQNPDNNFKITSSIERNLERLIIIPQEKEYGFDSFPYWNETMSKIIDQYNEILQNPWARKNNFYWIG